MSEVRRHLVNIPPELGGRRLDQALASLLEEYSRTQLTAWIKNGLVRLAGRPCNPRDPVAAGDQVFVAYGDGEPDKTTLDGGIRTDTHLAALLTIERRAARGYGSSRTESAFRSCHATHGDTSPARGTEPGRE